MTSLNRDKVAPFLSRNEVTSRPYFICDIFDNECTLVRHTTSDVVHSEKVLVKGDKMLFIHSAEFRSYITHKLNFKKKNFYFKTFCT